jgi:hypothetical protein
MAKLSSLVAAGGAVGDLYGSYKITTGGVLADKNYVWVEQVAPTLKTYAAAMLPDQTTKASYAAAQMAAQSPTMGGGLKTSLAAGSTGVTWADLTESTTIPNGLYLQVRGSFSPLFAAPANALPLIQPTIGAASITAQALDVVTVQWSVTMASSGEAATNLVADVFDDTDTAFATPLATQQTITTGIGRGAIVPVTFTGLDAMNGIVPRGFVLRVVANL